MRRCADPVRYTQCCEGALTRIRRTHPAGHGPAPIVLFSKLESPLGIMKELVKQVLPDEHSLPFHPAEFREERAPLSKISSKSRESFVCTEKDRSQHGGLSPGEYTIGAQNSPPIDKETAKENHGKRDSTWIRLRANRRVQRQWICLETQVPVRVGTHCRTRTSRHCVVECVYDMYLQRLQSKAAEEQTCGGIRGDERSCNGSGDPKTHRHGESVAANEVNILETKCKDYRKSWPVAEVAVLQEQKKAPPEGSECIVATVQELSAARMRHEDTKLTRDYLEDNAYSSGHLVGCQSNPYHENATHYHDSKMGKVTAGDGVVKQERDWYGGKLKESKGEHHATAHPSSEGGQNRETILGTAGRDQTIKSWRLLRIKHPLHQVWVALEGEMWTRSGKSWQLFPVMQLVVLRNLEEDQDLRRKADYASGAAPLSAVTADSDKTRNCSDIAGKTYPDNGRLDENHTFSQQKPGTAARELTEGEQAHISAKKNSSAHIQSVKDQKLASAGSYIQAPLFPLLSQMVSEYFSALRDGSCFSTATESKSTRSEPTQLKEYLNSHQALHRLERSTSAASAYLFLEGDLAARISSLRLLTTVGVYSPDALRELVQLPHGSLISLFFDAFAPYEIPSFQNKQSRSADAFSDGITCLGLSEDSEAPPQRTRKSNIEAVLEFVLALCKDEGVRKSLVDKGLVPLVGNLLTVMLEKRFPLVCVSGDSSASIYNADEPPTNYRDWGFSLHPRTQPDCVTAGKGFLLIQILQDNEKAKELKVRLDVPTHLGRMCVCVRFRDVPAVLPFYWKRELPSSRGNSGCRDMFCFVCEIRTGGHRADMPLASEFAAEMTARQWHVPETLTARQSSCIVVTRREHKHAALNGNGTHRPVLDDVIIKNKEELTREVCVTRFPDTTDGAVHSKKAEIVSMATG
uniref:Uncharacterized protein n=1 Tax=Toxoplasma gondii (strain ATCC 50861 / VEG) TaxID=432359 RepID=A0A0F7V2S9_TOXGV|nr:TPA: hypothetical protein BN1205_074565 [Toxoplasma gondii VEG]